MNRRKVRLYVKSVKNPMGTEKIGREKFIYQTLSRPGQLVDVPRTPQLAPVYDVESTIKYDFVLPEHQKKVVEMVKEVASDYDFEVEVIDVTRMDILDKILQKEVKELQTFPTLVTDSGRKLEIRFSREDIEWLLSKEAENNEGLKS